MKDEKEKRQAEMYVLVFADKWAREMLRSDETSLKPHEIQLLEAVRKYNKVLKEDLPVDPIRLPNPPRAPHDFNELMHGIESEPEPTRRYSDIPTKPSPAYGMPAVRPSKLDIDLDEYDKE
jgi:hypothetical protein